MWERISGLEAEIEARRRLPHPGLCCLPNCFQPATYRITWGEIANPDNFTHACEAHVGAMLGHHPGQVVDGYRVTLIGKEG
jgi:hypothetical protein